MKTCTVCRQGKDESSFPRAKGGIGGVRGDCRECYRRTQAKRRLANGPRPRSPDEKARHNRHMWVYGSAHPDFLHERNIAQYGLTVARYQQIFDMQGGVCAICQSPPGDSRTKRLAVDHCHKTGKVRGLLCGRCNRGLGLMGDDLSLLKAAVTYLDRG